MIRLDQKILVWSQNADFLNYFRKMGYIAKNWQGVKNSLNLSQRFLDKIKPETTLKNRINDAEKKMI